MHLPLTKEELEKHLVGKTIKSVSLKDPEDANMKREGKPAIDTITFEDGSSLYFDIAEYHWDVNVYAEYHS